VPDEVDEDPLDSEELDCEELEEEELLLLVGLEDEGAAFAASGVLTAAMTASALTITILRRCTRSGSLRSCRMPTA